MAIVLINKGYKPVQQFGVLLGLLGAGFLGAGLVSIIIAKAVGIPIANMADAVTNPAFRGTMRLMQAVSTFVLLGLPAILFAAICYKNSAASLGFHNNLHWKLIGLVILIMLAASPLSDALGSLNKAIPIPGSWRTLFDKMEKTYEIQVEAMVDVSNLRGFFISAILIAVLPAVFEEVLFRGALQGVFLRWFQSPWPAIILAAFLFSAIHMSWYGFIPRFALGIVLGAVYYATGNIWYPILMHFLNNLLALLMLYYLEQKNEPFSLSEASIFPWWAGVISLVVIIGLINLLFKWHPPQKVTEQLEDRYNPFGKLDQLN